MAGRVVHAIAAHGARRLSRLPRAKGRAINREPALRPSRRIRPWCHRRSLSMSIVSQACHKPLFKPLAQSVRQFFVFYAAAFPVNSALTKLEISSQHVPEQRGIRTFVVFSHAAHDTRAQSPIRLARTQFRILKDVVHRSS